MVMVTCETSKREIVVDNTPHLCAERRLLQYMRHRSRIEGVNSHCFSHWFHRKMKRIIIYRIRQDGNMGTSIPCIFCRKVLDKLYIDWEAHVGESWVSSKDENVPRSKFTQKQLGIFYPRPRQPISGSV